MIRKAKSEDAINLATLSIQVWLDSYATDGIRKEISQHVLTSFTESYFSELIACQNYGILVYEEKEHLVGYIMANFNSLWKDASNGYEIDKLYVQFPFQGRGIGRSLILEMAARFGDTFWLSTWFRNEKAIEFYKHLGFIDIGHTYFELQGESHENRVLLFK